MFAETENSSPSSAALPGRVPPRPRGRLAEAALGLSAAAVVLHVVAMFPGYYAASAPSLSAQPDQAGLYAVVAASWAGVVALLAAGTRRPRLWSYGAAAAFGVGLIELGFRVGDLGSALQGGHVGAGLWLISAGWVAGAAGAGAALALARRRDRRTAAAVPPWRRPVAPRAVFGGLGGPARIEWTRPGVLALLVFCGAAAAVAFIPAWDLYQASAAGGQTVRVSAGNAFHGPALYVVGNIVVVVALIGLPFLAGLWRPPVLGAAAILGMVANFSGQFVAAGLQAGQRVSPSALGIPPAQAQAEGIRVGLHLTAWFPSDVIAVFALVVAAAVLAITRPVPPRQPAAAFPAPPGWPWAPPPPAGGWPGGWPGRGAWANGANGAAPAGWSPWGRYPAPRPWVAGSRGPAQPAPRWDGADLPPWVPPGEPDPAGPEGELPPWVPPGEPDPAGPEGGGEPPPAR